MIEIKTGETSDFFEAPFRAYGSESGYVSPFKADILRFIDKTQNPLFTQGQSDIEIFTAYKDGALAGRITAHIHAESNALYQAKFGYFGYFDCVNDEAVAHALLEAAEGWNLERGMDEIRGNFNLTAMQQIGVVTDGFDQTTYTDLAMNPPHIPKLLEKNGYQPFFPMTTFELDLQTTPLPQLGEKHQRVMDDPDFEFIPITRWNVDARMEDARVILNAAFANNPMFVPVSQDEFHFQAKDMKWVVDPRISKLLYYQGRPAACIICIPDLNPLLRATKSRMTWKTPFQFVAHKFKNRRAVLIFSGVIPELQGQGVNPVVLYEVMKALKDARYEKLGNTWIGDSNKASLRQKEIAGAHKLHRIHLYQKALRP